MLRTALLYAGLPVLLAMASQGCEGANKPSETGGADDTGGGTDADGDGVPASADCDDNAPWMWQGQEARDGDAVLSSDAEVRTFCAGSCGLELGGDLRVQETVSDTTALSCLRSVGGAMYIQDDDELSSLSGLTALQSVGTDLEISGDGSLEDFSGLDALNAVGGTLQIAGNPALSSLTGLSGLRSVGGSLDIEDNVVLTSVTALYGLTEVRLDVIIADNPALPNADAVALVSQIDSIGGDLTVSGNAP